MPFDAVFLRAVRQELEQSAIGAKIDKVQQPERNVLVLSLRTTGGNARLLISANPNSARIHFTRASMENPAQPPMFCMLLRKHLVGARILSFTQPGLERVLRIGLECTDEMGEKTQRCLAVELMGRNSNVVFIGEDGRIMDCLRRVDFEMSEKRQVLPGLFYHEPPAQEKLDPLEADEEVLMNLISEQTGRADAWLLDHFSGLSPLVCRELVWRHFGAVDASLEGLRDAERQNFVTDLLQFFETIRQGIFTPVLLVKDAPSDFSYTEIGQYENLMQSRSLPDFSQLLDSFYAERDHAEQMRQKGQALRKTVANLRDRAARKLAYQRQELEATYGRERLRQFGDLLMANQHLIQRGAKCLRCIDFYDPEGREVEIPLQEALSPQQNAAKYYKDYSRAKNAEKILTEQIAAGEQELTYFGSVLDELQRAESEKDLNEIRQELMDGHYLRTGNGKKQMKQQPTRPMEFYSGTGVCIYVGRNNRQNDQLTLKTAQKGDVWLHTQKIHGSHVIITCAGQAPDEQTLEEAASLAAYFSQAREGQNVPVDFTQVRNVKKPNGAKPGMVIYDHYHTTFVTPSPELVERLKNNRK